MLIRLGLVEQRHKAVLEVLGGATVTDVALRYGVTRQTVHRWLRSYARFGLGGLVDHPSRPARCPHQMPAVVEARIVELRRTHPLWGPRTIRHQLTREGLQPLPGRSSIYRCLVRHGLIDPQKRRRKREDYRRWERSRSMELWQMDVMGGVKLEGGRELKIITGLDDHSRFCVSAMLVPRATARPVCEALAQAMRRYGVPDQILTACYERFVNSLLGYRGRWASNRVKDSGWSFGGLPIVPHPDLCPRERGWPGGIDGLKSSDNAHDNGRPLPLSGHMPKPSGNS